MTGQMIPKQDYIELMMGEASFIRLIADNIYTFAVADGMGRAFEALRRDTVLPEEGR